MLTIFANMLINSTERLEHLKDSFESFADTSDDWLINIRGKKREETIAFLKSRLGNKATFFELLDDSRGWSRNSLDMLAHAKHSHVFVWLEDHMNIAPQKYMRDVVAEMAERSVDYLQYSWWQNGKFTRQFEVLPLTRGRTIDSIFIDRATWRTMLKAGNKPHLVSLLGIFKKEFLQKLLRRDLHMFPALFTKMLYRAMTLLQRFGLRFEQKIWFGRINRMSGFRFRPFSTYEAPHDIEKPYFRFDILPIRIALLHQEMFVCMDDDDDPNDPYALMTRGLYPIRDLLVSWNPQPLSKYVSETRALTAGTSTAEAYCYYSAKGVRHVLSREHISVIRGKIRVTVKSQHLELSAGQGASVFTNIRHEILALEDSEIVRFTPDLGLAPHYIVQ
ncbi:hypothetical protein HY968_00860 [Candidatus Kaiserbacteria bacterium]|nr:hypothetical protein [Candidatus Kaiserbacteria bacterium]